MGKGSLRCPSPHLSPQPTTQAAEVGIRGALCPLPIPQMPLRLLEQGAGPLQIPPYCHVPLRQLRMCVVPSRPPPHSHGSEKLPTSEQNTSRQERWFGKRSCFYLSCGEGLGVSRAGPEPERSGPLCGLGRRRSTREQRVKERCGSDGGGEARGKRWGEGKEQEAYLWGAELEGRITVGKRRSGLKG